MKDKATPQTLSSDSPKPVISFLGAFAALAGAVVCAGGAMHIARMSGASVNEDKDIY